MWGNLVVCVGCVGYFLVCRVMECIGKCIIFFWELCGEEFGWGIGEINDIGLLEGDWCGVGFLNFFLLGIKEKSD